MGIDRITEPLRIYQQAAQNILSSPALREGPLLNKVDFINTFIDETNQAGYRFYNVAEGGADVPAAAKSGRIIGTGNKGEYVVEFVDAEKKVISQSDPMTMAEANKLKGEIGSGRAAQKSVLNEAGQFQRSIVSPFYILASPGTWATNIIGGMATALGDGDFAFARNRTITDWIGKQYGIDPTVRGLEGVMSAASPASQFSDKGPFKFLKKLSNAYSKIDEFTGNRVFYASANKAMRQVGREVLTNAVTPLLTGAGVDARTAKRMVGHLYEAGLRGDDLVGEFNKLLNGQTKILNLAEINPTWLDAIPPDAMGNLQKIIQGATSRDGALAALRQWGEETGKHWDTLIASSPAALPRYVWQKQETFQDAAEIKQAANMATKYGEVPAEAAQSTVKTISDGMTETQRRMQTLAQIVTESADPKNRYVLYNIWGQVNDLTAGVRAQLGEMAEAANGLTGPAKNKAWQDFWSTTDRLWTERNTKVNQLLEDANTAMAAGQDFTPRLDQWKILERTASMDEAKLWETMRLDPTSGRYDPRLKQVIDAGRAITDKGWARVYAAARRFLNVDAMDYIVSAEHSIQMAGAQAGDYLELARNKARKANTDKAWSEFFQIRNEVRRQQRVYEKSVLENATYHIVSDGLGAETSTGLKFDAGPDGTVELIRPRDIETTSTDKLSKERRTKATTRTEWDVRREDGTTTTVPDNMVPAELKAKYKGVTDEAKAAEIEMELDNIASVEPYAPEAQAIIDNPNPGATAELFEANVERLASADVGFPGSRALDEAEGLRAERAAAPANDLNALRKAAKDAGIPTLTDAGRPMDKRLINTINKDLGLKLRGLRDLTPEQYTAAMEALARRATSAPAAAPAITRYTPPPEQVATVERTLQPELERVARRAGTTVDELVAQGNQALQPLLQSPVAIQVATGNIDNILSSGGLQNAFSTRKTSPGKATSLDYRASAEAKGLGIPTTAAPEEHAVYGYLLVDDYARKLVSTPQFDMGYGDISFVLKDDVRARTTFTVGDSVNQFDKSRAVGIPLDGEPSVTAWGAESPAVWGLAQNGNIQEFLDQVAYVETHTQGGVKLSDVQKVLDPNSKLTPAQVQRLEAQGIQVVQGAAPEMRTYDFTVQALDPEKVAKALNFGGWWGKDARKASADALRRTTEAGGAVAGDLSHGAMFAKQQLENILSYMENNIDEILKPPGKITQGQNLQAIDAFRKNVLPAWDNVKYAASEYGNRMRSFTMVDFANMTRLDEIMSLYMPYGFWMTRTAKNSLERAIFQPHIWRRVMQTEREIRSMQDQEGDPQRYEGAIPIDMGNGVTQYMRILPSKYWPAAGIFTSNDYADPESANSALGYATESMRAANLASYPWWDAGAKIWENISGGEDWNADLYPVNYTPQGRIAADFAIKMFGADAAQYMVPGYFENSVARTLNNMAVKGEITNEQARWAHDYLWQLKQGGKPLPDAETGAYDPAAIEAILDKAMRATAGVDLQGALTSWATGVSVRPYDQAEGQWSGAATNYQNYKYGPENPYGSKSAADTQKPDAALAWSKAGVWRPEEQRPGVSMATDAKSAEKEALNAELMAATDEFISGFNGTPTNKQVDTFKDEWMAEQTGIESDYFVDSMNEYLDEKYPSATTFEPTGGERYPGYAPEEIRQKVRIGAYYQAQEELKDKKAVNPGDNATSAQWDKYFADKAAYDKAVVARVAELINDPVAIRQLAGLPVTNAPTSISDYLRSNSADTFNLNNALGYPMRPTGEGTFNAGMTDLAGDPETAEAIIEAEKTKYMSELEKQVRAANEANGDSSGRGGRSYRGRGYTNRRSSGRRGYSRRGYGGGGGGGGGGTYNVPDVYGKGLSEWLNVDPERVGYQAPNQVRVNVPDIGPEAMRAWKKLSW